MYGKRHGECMQASKELGVSFLADIGIKDIGKVDKLQGDIQKRAKHVIEEIDRVHQVVKVLESNDMAAVGKLLIQSHRSSQK